MACERFDRHLKSQVIGKLWEGSYKKRVHHGLRENGFNPIAICGWVRASSVTA